MRIEDKTTHKEIYPQEGMLLRHKNGFFSRGSILLPNETEEDYTEVSEDEYKRITEENDGKD